MPLTIPSDLEAVIADLRDVLVRRALKFGKFKLSAGGESSYYIDCRKASMTFEGMRAIANAILVLCRDQGWSPNVICGPESAGIPLVCAVVSQAPRWHIDAQGAFVRKEAREHGMRDQIAGCDIERQDRVLVVEDVATTGSSIIKTIQAVFDAGANVLGAVVLLDRLQGAGEKIQQLGVPYKPLLTIKDLGLEPGV